MDENKGQVVRGELAGVCATALLTCVPWSMLASVIGGEMGLGGSLSIANMLFDLKLGLILGVFNSIPVSAAMLATKGTARVVVLGAGATVAAIVEGLIVCTWTAAMAAV